MLLGWWYGDGMDTLETRVAALERSVRTWRRVGIVAICASVLGVMLGVGGTGVFEAIKTKNLTLVDNAGRKRAELRMVNSQPALKMFAANGRERLSVDVNGGTPGFALRDAGGNPAALFTAYPNALGLFVFDGDGSARVSLGLVDGTPGVDVHDPDGTVRASLAVYGTRPDVFMQYPDGSTWSPVGGFR